MYLYSLCASVGYSYSVAPRTFSFFGMYGAVSEATGGSSSRLFLRILSMRLYVDENNIPIYGMIIYVIDYKKEQMNRSACGGYYPFVFDNSEFLPHPYQESILCTLSIKIPK